MTTKEEAIKELKKEASVSNLEKILAEKVRQDIDENLLKNFNEMYEMFEKKKGKLP